MTRMTTKQAAKRFAETIRRVSATGERIVVSGGGKQLVAIVPIEDWRAFQLLEDQLDIAAVRKAKKGKGKPISLDKLATDLGIRRPHLRSRSENRELKKAG